MLQSDNPELRQLAIQNLQTSAEIRTLRAQPIPSFTATSTGLAPSTAILRHVHDLQNALPTRWNLPGPLARTEGDPATGDNAVDESYDGSGQTDAFYRTVFSRNSIDNAGTPLVSSVHAGTNLANAFWNGMQMVYGDGDGSIYRRLTLSLDVIGHEFTHGVIDSESKLQYRDQPGALNEHFADVFGSLIKQWTAQHDAAAANWLIGDDVVVNNLTRRAIRDMANPGTAYVNDPDIGTDPQVSHFNDLYTGPLDNGGVHWNSGIPNKAFHLFATALGGNAWDIPGSIWYDALRALHPLSDFNHMASITRRFAAAVNSATFNALDAAWNTVGL